MMLTGDASAVARWVARELALDEFFAEVLPDQKATRIDVEVSAVKGTNLDKLLETILLQAEVLDLKGYDPDADRYDFTPLYLREEEICRH